MTVELFDTHCHLTFKHLQDQTDRVIAEAADAGVTRLVTVACSAAELEAVRQLRDRYAQIWLAAGVHPHEAARAGEDDVQRIAAFWQTEGVVAAGEMGLDYHYDFSPRDVQQAIFRRQLDLAAGAGLPVIIHCREAHDDVVRILIEQGHANRPVVFHCFSGNAEAAREILEQGWWLSYTGVVTFKNADEVREALAITPADRLMFETDAPYLSPEPVRKMRPNEPKNVAHTVRFAAEVRNLSFEELAAQTTANALDFFRLR